MADRTETTLTLPGPGGGLPDAPSGVSSDYSLRGEAPTTGPAGGSRRPSVLAPLPRSPWPVPLLSLSLGEDLVGLYLESALEWVRSQSLEMSGSGRKDSTEAYVAEVLVSLSPDERKRLRRVEALAERYHRVLELLG